MVHRILNTSCPRNNPRNETICTCDFDNSGNSTARHAAEARGVYLQAKEKEAMSETPKDNYGMGLPVSPSDPREHTPHQARVEDFMRKAGQEVPESPTMPSEEVRRLRAKLVFEEAVKELIMLGLGIDIKVPIYNSEGQIECWRSFGPETKFEFFPATNRKPNLNEIADGCIDTSVVTIGTLSACGIADARLLEEVDRSNLSKFIVPKCSDCDCVMGHSGDGQYVCQYSPRHRTAKGPYRSTDGKWVKGPQYSPADIAGVLEKQMPTKEAITDELSVARAMLTDSASYLSEIGLASFANAVLQVKKDLKDVQFKRAYSPPHGTSRKLAPNPLGGAPIDLTTFHDVPKKRAVDDGPQYDTPSEDKPYKGQPKRPESGDIAEGVKAAAAAQAEQFKFNSGGIVMCPLCRNPISDEMVKNLRSGKLEQGTCPGCLATFTYADLSNPRIH